jgi:hypothetical protein
VTQAPENGQNYNRYTYAYNNPLKYSDPSGYINTRLACVGDSCNAAYVESQPGQSSTQRNYSEPGRDVRVVELGPFVGNSAAFEMAGRGHTASNESTVGDRKGVSGGPVAETVPVDEDDGRRLTLGGYAPKAVSIDAQLVMPAKIVEFFSDLDYDIGLGGSFILDLQTGQFGFSVSTYTGGSEGVSFGGFTSVTIHLENITDIAGSGTSGTLMAGKYGLGISVNDDGSVASFSFNGGFGYAVTIGRETTTVFIFGDGWSDSGCDAFVC